MFELVTDTKIINEFLKNWSPKVIERFIFHGKDRESVNKIDISHAIEGFEVAIRNTTELVRLYHCYINDEIFERIVKSSRNVVNLIFTESVKN